MERVTMRQLRNEGGKVVDRVLKGERLIVTRDGTPVAELRPLQRRGTSTDAFLERWRRIPHTDPEALREDIDEIFDQSL